MNKKMLIGLSLSIIVLATGVFVLKNKKQGTEIKVSNKPVFTIQETRQRDLGFKLKLDECIQEGQNKFILVDVDNNETYVFANTKQYFAGPHPIKEEELIKKSIKEFDNLVISKLDCAKLEQEIYTKN